MTKLTKGNTFEEARERSCGPVFGVVHIEEKKVIAATKQHIGPSSHEQLGRQGRISIYISICLDIEITYYIGA